MRWGPDPSSMQTPTPDLELMNWKNTKVVGNAVVAFHLRSDYLFGEAPSRETNAAGYLMRMCEDTLQSNTGQRGKKRGEYIRTRVPFVDRPHTWSPRSL